MLQTSTSGYVIEQGSQLHPETHLCSEIHPLICTESIRAAHRLVQHQWQRVAGLTQTHSGGQEGLTLALRLPNSLAHAPLE